MKPFFNLLVMLYVLSACTSGEAQLKDNLSSEQESTEPPIETNQEIRETGNSIFKLLQGTWQSKDDPSNKIKFDGNYRLEIAEGLSEWEKEAFILGKDCSAEQHQDLEKDAYIVCPESGMCWYVVDVDTQQMTLSYTSRGNTLTYSKVKE